MFLLVILLINKLILLAGTHPDENLTITEFIQKYKYPVEVHEVETPDGYILKLYRIPHGVSNTASKEVVLLVHGLLGSAENFIVIGPPNALAFYLADRSYDVWLFNARGNAHSRKHILLNPNIDRKKFWDFSWHEIGVIDLPSSINYIIKKTGKDKIYYAGHSQGTTVIFVMLSEVPEMNEKIKVAALLAPSVKLNYTHSPLITLGVRLQPLGQRISTMFNWHELLIPNSPMLNGILKSLCNSKTMADVCMDILYIIGGAKSGYTNKTLLPTILQTGPSGCAVKQAWHYAQVVKTGEFKRYDFGKRKNLKIYNSTCPPFYNLSKVIAPLGLFFGPGDHFANAQMVKELSKELPNVALEYEINATNFNHLDFIFASIIKEAVYDPLYELFKKYE